MNDVFEKISRMLAACYPVFYMQSHEYERTKGRIRGVAVHGLKGETHVYQWNIVEGLSRDTKNGAIAIENNEDYLEVLRYIAEKMRQAEEGGPKQIFILEDFSDYLEDERVRFYIRRFSEEAKYSNTHIIILSAVYKIPQELEKVITYIPIPLPNETDLGKTLDEVLRGKPEVIPQGLKAQIVEASKGMTVMEADLAYSLAYVQSQMNTEAPRIVSAEKEQIIRKSRVLEFFPKSGSMKDVGGMDNLKLWLSKRRKAFEAKAREWGLPEPKGLLLLGVPGCGKSLTAKVIASSWDLPLLRLDIGRVFEGIVGSSEDNIRQALATTEAVAPCVLWIDEIEKGLSGTVSSGATDGGTTSRIFSTILTWMQEKSSPVFVVATANDISQLPPELLRKGRFDEIFFVDLPVKEERKNIFSIHLSKKGQDISKFPVEELVRLSEGFNGAEIEESIKEAMFSAYMENPQSPQLGARHLIDAVKSVVPLSSTMKEQIDFLRRWADVRAKNAYQDKTLSLKQEGMILTPAERERTRSYQITDIEKVAPVAAVDPNLSPF